MQGIDPFGGIDPPSYELNKFSQIVNPFDYISVCIKCGKTHGWTIQNMTTGEVNPIDICEPCLFKEE